MPNTNNVVGQFNDMMKDFDKTFAKVEASNAELEKVIAKMKEQKAQQEKDGEA